MITAVTEDELLRVIGHNVRWRRKHCKMTQQSLADRLGVSREYVAQIESGRKNVPVRTLARIADLLGAEPDVFLRPGIFSELTA